MIYNLEQKKWYNTDIKLMKLQKLIKLIFFPCIVLMK